MAQDWEGFLDLADKLSGGATPAELRSAISRAYYSTYHVFLDFVKKTDETFDCGPNSKDVHSRLWLWFRQRKNRIAKRVADEGFAFRDKRKNADYDDKFDGDLAKEAKLAVMRARSLNKLSEDKNL
jgi:hypothetical protein